MRVTTVIKIVVVLAVALVATGIAVLMSIDFSAFKGDVETIVQERTGRDLKIEGDFSLRLGFTPAVVVNDVRLANAPWGSRPDMASVRKLAIEMRLLPLLVGDIRIKRLVLIGADILLETNADGRGNWIFDAGGGKSGGTGGGTASPPRIDRVRIEGARFVWHDGQTGSGDEVTINSLDAEIPGSDAPMRMNLRAQYGGAPVFLAGIFGSPSGLTRASGAWPFDIQGEIGGAALALQGSAGIPFGAGGIDASLSIKGDDLSKLGAVSGVALPAVGPYRLETRLSGRGTTWTAGNLTIAVGRSSAAGEVAVDLGPTPPQIKAVLSAPLIDLNDFARRDSVEPGKPAENAASSAPAARPPGGPAGPKTDHPRVIPDMKLPLGGLSTVDAQLSLRAARLIAGPLSFSDAAADFRLKGGALVVKPVEARLAGAPVKAELRIVPNGKKKSDRAPTVSLKLGVEKIDLATALKMAGKPGFATGKVNFSLDLKGSGSTVRTLASRLDGTSEIVMGRGTIDDDTLELLSADVIKAISPWSEQSRNLRINCLVGRYRVNDGRIASDATLLDTDRVAVTGEGGLDLATEGIGFTLVPHAKEASLLRLAVPIRVAGTLANPAIYPDAGYIAKGTVSTVLGLPGEVIDQTIGRILGGGDGEENRCVAALKEGGKTASGKPAGPVEGVGRALEGIGKGIGEGLKNLFGQ